MAHSSGNPTWQDSPSTATLISAAALENIEGSIDHLVIIPTPHLRVWGHSYASGVGVGVTAGVNDFVTITAANLNLPLSNLAVGGTVLYNYTSAAANWDSVLQAETRPALRFAPIGGSYVVMYGINDLDYLGNTTALITTFTMSLRTIIARMRASTVLEDSDSSVTYGGSGTWSVLSPYTAGNSGNSVRYNATAGATFTVTTPASFPGGTITLGFTNWNDGSGATVTGTVNGTSYSINTVLTSRTDSLTPAVLRIPNVPKGSHAYTFTSSSPAGGIGLAFDYWQWEPEESGCPLVVLVQQPKPLDYTAYSGDGSPYDPTDAGVDALRSVHSSLAAEFGSNVLVVDTSAIDKSATYFTTGNIHPNVAGHAYIAAQVTAAMTPRRIFMHADLTVPDPVTAAGALWTAYTPALSGTGTSLGNGTLSGAYVKDAAGTVDFWAQVTLGTTSAIGSQVQISLPVSAFSPFQYSAWSGWGQHSGFATYLLAAFSPGGTTLTPSVIGASGIVASITTTTPFTWGSTDVLEIHGTYRAA